MTEECQEGDSENADMIHRLETQLTKQLKMCLSTRDHHKAMGDVAGMNRFETLALSVTKDLDLIRLVKRRGDSALPKFHYENKDFSIVKSNTDLNDNDLEMTIVRGINFNCTNPKDIDTYVKYEFPYPTEEPVKDKTGTVKDTNNPEYNATVMFEIQRKQRACQRIFKRQAIKLEVFSKGYVVFLTDFNMHELLQSNMYVLITVDVVYNDYFATRRIALTVSDVYCTLIYPLFLGYVFLSLFYVCPKWQFHLIAFNITNVLSCTYTLTVASGCF